ncbi:TetR/AcrR family transcriptional regulator [Pseudoflavitalea sp. G-6-1-2]|uniref:TetR/AcrR family transcriptional regulator n=1 Tax=Pseudoflavitalea sp. G-6-1-2 TaxID=2728841 RepID=UPI00146CAF40|nr:TetR/AcrR family transcriptional regulator [Pseudoflavitalea sp. G-6-1-2]NML20322.1 TetR/AcrR family transcriptional regulator [Pseudoflavitalea sp. G-6-1-2]
MTLPDIQTRERIRQKADELFMQLGTRNVSMDDIARDLGMSKKTIYQSYNDKDELVNAVLDFILSKMKRECEECKTDSHDAIHELILTMELLAEQFRNMNPIILHDLEKHHTAAFMKFVHYKQDYLFTVVKENMMRGIREELFRADLNVDVLSKFRLESMMMPFNTQLFPTSKYTLIQVIEVIMGHYMFGLATAKGHALILQYKAERIKSKPI